MKARKLILSIFAVGACVATFSTTTYAWFRMNSRAQVSNLSFKVISGLGFKIAVDASNSAYFTDTLTTDQMEAAIVRGYNPDKYVFYQNKLYEYVPIEELKPTAEDPNHKEVVSHRYIELSKTDIQNILSNIKLDLATTMVNDSEGHTTSDGYSLYNEFGEAITDRNKYLEFSLYFKTDSDLVSDNQHFGIYISDDTTYVKDGQKDKDGNPIEVPMNPTSIKSAIQQIKLVNDMSYLNKDYEMVNLSAGDFVSMSLNNAIRFSTRDLGVVKVTPKETGTIDYSIPDEGKEETPKTPENEETTETTTADIVVEGNVITSNTKLVEDEEINDGGVNTAAKIYELSDENNLGSYITNYDGDENEEKRMYGANYSAMYSYYNSLGAASDEVKPLNYNDLKEMYEAGKIVNDLDPENILTVVDSGLDAHKITFRFWLEGFDSDYFAGVSGLVPISCNLSFKVNSKYGRN